MATEKPDTTVPEETATPLPAPEGSGVEQKVQVGEKHRQGIKTLAEEIHAIIDDLNTMLDSNTSVDVEKTKRIEEILETLKSGEEVLYTLKDEMKNNKDDKEKVVKAIQEALKQLETIVTAAQGKTPYDSNKKFYSRLLQAVKKGKSTTDGNDYIAAIGVRLDIHAGFFVPRRKEFAQQLIDSRFPNEGDSQAIRENTLKLVENTEKAAETEKQMTESARGLEAEYLALKKEEVQLDIAISKLPGSVPADMKAIKDKIHAEYEEKRKLIGSGLIMNVDPLDPEEDETTNTNNMASATAQGEMARLDTEEAKKKREAVQEALKQAGQKSGNPDIENIRARLQTVKEGTEMIESHWIVVDFTRSKVLTALKSLKLDKADIADGEKEKKDDYSKVIDIIAMLEKADLPEASAEWGQVATEPTSMSTKMLRVWPPAWELRISVKV